MCPAGRLETEAEAVQQDAESWTLAMLTLMQQPPSAPPDLANAGPSSSSAAADPDRGQAGGRREDRLSRRPTASASGPGGLSKEEAGRLLDRASLSTMDGCLTVLAAINVREVLQESE